MRERGASAMRSTAQVEAALKQSDRLNLLLLLLINSAAATDEQQQQQIFCHRAQSRRARLVVAAAAPAVVPPPPLPASLPRSLRALTCVCRPTRREPSKQSSAATTTRRSGSINDNKWPRPHANPYGASRLSRLARDRPALSMSMLAGFSEEKISTDTNNIPGDCAPPQPGAKLVEYPPPSPARLLLMRSLFLLGWHFRQSGDFNCGHSAANRSRRPVSPCV